MIRSYCCSFSPQLFMFYQTLQYISFPIHIYWNWLMWVFGRFFPIEKWNSLCLNLGYWEQTKKKCLQRRKVERSLYFISVTVSCVCVICDSVFQLFSSFFRLYFPILEWVSGTMYEGKSSKFDTIDFSFLFSPSIPVEDLFRLNWKSDIFALLLLFSSSFCTTSWKHSTK